MSRIGKLPIALPAGVNADIQGLTVTIAGPRGQITKNFAGNIQISQEGQSIHVKPLDDEPTTKALWGTARSITNNLVRGVVEGFSQELEINGVGYKAAIQSGYLNMALGKSHSIKIKIPSSITVDVPKPTVLMLHSIDKEKLGQFASILISKSPPEPYKGKGIKKKGQVIQRKKGKREK